MKLKPLLLLGHIALYFSLAMASPPSLPEANNQLTFDLYKSLAKTPGNAVFSPFSIETALGMASLGAQEETRRQMLRTLHLSGVQDREFKNLLGQLSADKNITLEIANRIWGESSRSFLPDFLETLKLNFNSDIVAMDFHKNPEPSRIKINTWVEERTKDKIKNLLPEGIITDRTILVITNAVYFLGNWVEKFAADQTKSGPFYKSSGATVQTPFMNHKAHYRFLRNADAEFLEMNYKGYQLAMDVILPAKNSTLSELEEKLNEKALASIFQKMVSTQAEVEVSLPKFKIETTFTGLKKSLIDLGMKDAFDLSRANFHGITAPAAGDNIYISDVVHKAFIEVNESGTEAAAATALVLIGSAAMLDPKPPEKFIADRPFLFMIRHLKTGTILFIGRVLAP